MARNTTVIPMKRTQALDFARGAIERGGVRLTDHKMTSTGFVAVIDDPADPAKRRVWVTAKEVKGGTKLKVVVGPSTIWPPIVVWAEWGRDADQAEAFIDEIQRSMRDRPPLAPLPSVPRLES